MKLTLEIEGDFDPQYVEHLRSTQGEEKQMLMFPVAVSLARVERQIEDYFEFSNLPLGSIVRDHDDDDWRCYGDGKFACESTGYFSKSSLIAENTFDAYKPWILLPKTWSPS